MREALWMQIFAFPQPMWRRERSSLSDSRTFQPQRRGGKLNEKHKKKHEILAFKPLLATRDPIEKPGYQKDFLKL